MSHDSTHSEENHSIHSARPRPEGLREFSPRAIVCGLVVAVIMGASYPYIVLKMGFGPNVSVVAAILGYLILGILLPPLLKVLGIKTAEYNRWENNIVQTAGTAGAQTAFMCILLAAFDMLSQKPEVSFGLALTEVQSFAWLSTAGLLGVLMAVPLRRHYIVDEKLPFPDGLAAGETLIVCDSAGPVAYQAALTMVTGMVASAVLMMCLEDSHVFNLFSSTLLLGPATVQLMRFGVEWSLLAVGSGILIGLRIAFSMLLGTVLSWVIAPYALPWAKFLPAVFKRQDVLTWVMWPATGMMVAGGLTTLFMRWKVLARSFKGLTVGTNSDEFPLSWVIIGMILTGGALVIIQKEMLGQPIWITLTAIALSAPLALVGLRVLGETNWGPISALSNMMQGIFAFLAPGNVQANMVASGTTGTIASDSEAIMQDYKAGDMIGSSPRYLTYMQLLATPFGAAAVAWMYPLLKNEYGIGGETGLNSPTSVRWAGFAEILAKGIEGLPPGALNALVVGSLVGIVLAILEGLVKDKTWILSPTGMGIGMLIPAAAEVTIFMGAIIGHVWTRYFRKSSEVLMIPLASGMIAGEALVAVVVPLVVFLSSRLG
jgi:uncharacterized oligopeptide transporter (OPT) family protein